MTATVIQVLGNAAKMFDRPVYLKWFDAEAHGGRGDAVLTEDIRQGIVYANLADAMLAWQTVPVCHPVRDDGQPNRPLTAFTVTFVDAP